MSLLSDEKLHELYRLENGLRQIHDATTRINSMLSDFDPALRHLPEFFLEVLAVDLMDKRRAHELALDQQRGSVMLKVLAEVTALTAPKQHEGRVPGRYSGTTETCGPLLASARNPSRHPAPAGG